MTTSPQPPTVFIVDDDAQAGESVRMLVQSMGVRAEAFTSASDFLAAYSPGQRGCLVTDIRMPEMSGVELQQELIERGVHLQVVALTAYAETVVTVKVMQQGALTLLDKPYSDDDLWDAIFMALQRDAAEHYALSHREEIRTRYRSLTEKEVDVLRAIVSGKPNKQIARQLDVSLRTVEARRHDIFNKMQARSVAELVRMVIEAGIDAKGKPDE